MSAVQTVKAVLRSLANPTTFKGGVFMERQPGITALPPPPPLNFKGAFEVVFVEPSGWLNIAARVSKAGLQQVTSVNPV